MHGNVFSVPLSLLVNLGRRICGKIVSHYVNTSSVFSFVFPKPEGPRV